MARATIKDLQFEIEELKQSIERRDNIIQQLNNEISEMIDNADNRFKNSSNYMQMEKRIKVLELKNRSLSDTIIHNEKIHKLKNERGAGRKSKFTDQQINDIKQYRSDGKTIKQIADIYSCSVGLIHKLIKE